MKKGILLCVLAWFVTALTALPVAASEEAAEFEVGRLVVARGIEDREPVDIGTRFSTDVEVVYCFLEAVNIKQDTTAIFLWLHNGKEVHKTELPLTTGTRWRAWAVKTVHGAEGLWVVELYDGKGNFLDSVEFWIE